MKFRSAFANYVFTVLPEDIVRDLHGRRISTIKGLKATFGENHVFDSEQAQRANRWTPEERLELERGILESPRFRQPHIQDMGGSSDPNVQLGNVMVYVLDLAPGQSIPSEHAEFVKECHWYLSDQASMEAQGGVVKESATKRCDATIDTPDGTTGCSRMAEAGRDYCLLHEPNLAEVAT